MSDPEAQPRRDGWFEHAGTWGEVVVGTVLASPKRTERWEVLEVAHGTQVAYGQTLWMRAREQTTGELKTIPPRTKTFPVKILTQSPRDTSTGEPTEPSDTAAIMLLVEELGASLLATRDERTGEITCPAYEDGQNHLDVGPGVLRRGLIEHLRLAHALLVEDDAPEEHIWAWHSMSHNPDRPDVGKAGFPHRHVPEDLTFL